MARAAETPRAIWPPDSSAGRRSRTWAGNSTNSRVEMHLVSRGTQQVAIPAAGIVASFAAGEPIWTENSQKYTATGIASLGTAAGFGSRQQWLDTDAGFALSLFQSERG